MEHTQVNARSVDRIQRSDARQVAQRFGDRRLQQHICRTTRQLHPRKSSVVESTRPRVALHGNLLEVAARAVDLVRQRARAALLPL